MNYFISLFNGDFWFGETHKQKKRVKTNGASVHLKETEGKAVNHFYLNKAPEKVKVPVTSLDTPHGYIPLRLEGIDANELFTKHNITLKCLHIDGQLFIKSLLLVSDEREFDCYHLGENQSMKITKENESLISFTIHEKNGKSDTIYAVNGRIVG